MDGEPFAGAILTLSGGEGATATTGADGRFTFSKAEAGVLHVVALGGVPSDVAFPQLSIVASVPADGEVEVDFAGERIATASITGTVTVDGEPAAAVTVRLDGSITKATDQRGVYFFDELVAGEHVVAVTPPGDSQCDPAERVVEVAVGGEATADFACVTPPGGDPGGNQAPSVEEIGELEVGIVGDRLTDSCPEGTLAADIDDAGPHEVVDEDRDGVPFIVLVLNVTIEGEYDPVSGEWHGLGNVLSQDGTVRSRQSADGVWRFDEEGSILFQGVLTVEFFDTNGSPQDFSDDLDICRATFDMTLRPVD